MCRGAGGPRGAPVTEREAFVSALSKMTYINNLRQISQKNIHCIHTLAHAPGEGGGCGGSSGRRQ